MYKWCSSHTLLVLHSSSPSFCLGEQPSASSTDNDTIGGNNSSAPPPRRRNHDHYDDHHRDRDYHHDQHCFQIKAHPVQNFTACLCSALTQLCFCCKYGSVKKSLHQILYFKSSVRQFHVCFLSEYLSFHELPGLWIRDAIPVLLPTVLLVQTDAPCSVHHCPCKTQMRCAACKHHRDHFPKTYVEILSGRVSNLRVE